MGKEVTQQQLLSLAAEIGTALTCCDQMDEMLQRSAAAFVEHLDVAFARIWVLDQLSGDLILRASAGLYTHLDGEHSHIKIGQYKIGWIAEQRKSHLTNEVLTDARISDKDWARKTGMVSFAGHPLLVEDQLVGVLAMFGQHALSDDVMQSIESVADGIALGIHRKQIEDRLNEREHIFAQFANNIRDVLWIVRPHGLRTVWLSPAAEHIFGYPLDVQYKDPMIFFNSIFPEDQPRMKEFMESTEALTVDSAQQSNDLEFRINRGDGEMRWLWTRAFPSFDAEGKVYQICGFTHDITERKEAERRVSEFYSTVSHELRTPLTSIRAALGLIEGGVTEPDSGESLELVSIARKEADRLIRLINDILDMRKMQAGKLPLNIMPLQPKDVVAGPVGLMRSFAHEHHVELVTTVQEDHPFLGDYDRVAQVLTNLLSNAIKFSPPGKVVRVAVQGGFAGRIRFAVSDEGVGIPAEDQSKLFGIFQQLDASDSRQRGGTGLGLAISKGIVEKMSGVIGFSSEVGVGSTFWFELPLAGPDGTAVKVEVDEGSRYSVLLEFVDDYSKTLPTRLESLKARLQEAKTAKTNTLRAECLAEVRKIRASSEPCGFYEVARQMHVVERLLEQLPAQGEAPELWTQVDSALQAIKTDHLRR
jgi:PAS domain S-box-containing protein